MPNAAQRQIIFDKVHYRPSAEQQAVHNSLHRIRLVAGGERSGKSKSSAMDMVARMFEGTLYWLVAADYERTKAEFGYIVEALGILGIPYEATKQVDPGEITTSIGIKFSTKSAKDPRKLAYEAPDGILVCESSQIDYETYLRLRGRLMEKRGWMLMSGTFESSLGWYVDMFNLGQGNGSGELKSFSLPTWSNLAIFPGGRSDPEIVMLEKQTSSDWFMERYGGVPCPPKGLVFPEFKMPVHATDGEVAQYDPTLPVFVWVDPGYSHVYAVLAAQKKGDVVAVIDEIYERGLVTEDIITIAQGREWWKSVRGGVIDIAGTQHQGMSSPQETWLQQAGISLRGQKIRIEDGIERVKTSLKVNPLTGYSGVIFNLKCRGLLSELGGCPSPIDGQTRVYKWRSDREGQVIGTVPDDKNNDAVKALTYGLVDMLGYTPKQAAKIVGFKPVYRSLVR